MTVAKGRPWGAPGALPAGGVLAASDAEARAVIEAARREGRRPPTIGLLGGDLCRTLGGTGDVGRLRSADAVTFPVDLVAVEPDGGPRRWFVAHLVAHDRAWTRVVVAMNAQWWRAWNLGPRAHPGDGRVDVYEASFAPFEILKVARRARLGAHLPHPRVRERRVVSAEVTFPRTAVIRLDGVVAARARALRLTVEPDAVSVVV